MARYCVKVDGWEAQGGLLSLSEAAAEAAYAHCHRRVWDATIHDGVSWRTLNTKEAAELVAAITEELR